MKILIIGCAGKVGTCLANELSKAHEVQTVSRNELDLEKMGSIDNFLSNSDHDCVINAAAYTDVDSAEVTFDRANLVNSDAVGEIARICADKDKLFIHFSTDYVFDGKKSSFYDENDTPNPINAYGRSKLLGEQLIQSSGCNFLIFRLSWIVMAGRECFLTTIAKLSLNKSDLSVVSDQIGAPTSANYIAEIITKVLDTQNFKYNEIYHLSCFGETSRYNYSKFIVNYLRQADIQTKLKTENINAIVSQQHTSKAIRPKNSRLDTKKLFFQLDILPKHWQLDSEQVLKRLLESEN